MARAGLAIASEKVFVGPSFEQESGVFDVCLTLHPFAEETAATRNATHTTYRGPVLCLTCAAHLNRFAQINEDTNEWLCPFCESTNPRFHPLDSSSAWREVYPELQGNALVVDYREQITHKRGNVKSGGGGGGAEDFELGMEGSASSSSSSSSMEATGLPVVLFALDVQLCADPHVLSLLTDAITALPKHALIGVVLYGRVMHMLRLAAASATPGVPPIAIDTFAADRNRAEAYGSLFSQAVHFAPCDRVAQNLVLMLSTISSLDTAPSSSARPSSRTALPRTDVGACTADALVGLAVAAGQPDHNACYAAGMRLVILSCRSLPLSKSFLSSQEVIAGKVSDYAHLGRQALASGCIVDVFHAGIAAARLDLLDALAGATGGLTRSAQNFEDASIRASLLSSLSLSSAWTFPTFASSSSSSSASSSSTSLLSEAPSTIEIRLCKGLSIDRVVGTIMSTDEISHYTGGTGLRSVDEDHLAYTLECIHQAAVASSSSSSSSSSSIAGPSLKDQTDLFNKLLARDEASHDKLLMCSLCRHDVFASLSAQLKATTSLAKASSSSSDKKNQTTQGGFAYIQVVVRRPKEINSGEANGGGGVKLTRVWTTRLEVTPDLNTYLTSLDESMWVMCVSKGIVAAHHDYIAEAFGGARRSVLTEENMDALATASASSSSSSAAYRARLHGVSRFATDSLLAIDQLTEKVADLWRGHSSKAMSVICCLYHLREGPLLDGPALQPQESYLLRSLTLYADNDVAKRILCPSIHVGIISGVGSAGGGGDASLAREQVFSLDVVPTDSLSLLSSLIAIIDLGDSIILRAGSPLASLDSGNKIWPKMLLEAQKRASSRHPVPSLYLLPRPGTSMDRLVFSRISPSHTDRKANALLAAPGVALLSDQDFSLLVASRPHTDQLTFASYLQQIVPNFHSTQIKAKVHAAAKDPLVAQTMEERGFMLASSSFGDEEEV